MWTECYWLDRFMAIISNQASPLARTWNETKSLLTVIYGLKSSERIYATLIESSCHILYWMIPIYLISSEIIYAGILFYGRAKQVYTCWQHHRQRLYFKLLSTEWKFSSWTTFSSYWCRLDCINVLWEGTSAWFIITIYGKQRRIRQCGHIWPKVKC